MKNFLAIDIGAGTMDILCWVPDENMHYKAVVQSPVRTLARQIETTRGNLVVDGVEMGGGPVTEALQARAETHRVAITARAAATLHHTLLFDSDTLPGEFNRLKSIARIAGGLPTEKVFVMDSGQAAILRASLDPSLKGKRPSWCWISPHPTPWRR